MIHPKKLIEMARKWHKKITDKGHFVVYTIDGERFMIPLSYLNSKIFEELLKMSEDEFGLSNEGPIVLPCDASLVKRMISLMRRQNSQEMERELIEFLTVANKPKSIVFAHCRIESARSCLLILRN